MNTIEKVPCQYAETTVPLQDTLARWLLTQRHEQAGEAMLKLPLLMEVAYDIFDGYGTASGYFSPDVRALFEAELKEELAKKHAGCLEENIKRKGLAPWRMHDALRENFETLLAAGHSTDIEVALSLLVLFDSYMRGRYGCAYYPIIKEEDMSSQSLRNAYVYLNRLGPSLSLPPVNKKQRRDILRAPH